MKTVNLSESLEQRLHDMALRRECSEDRLIEEALECYFLIQERRQADKAAADQAWAKYQASGLHISGDEAEDWLNTWGTEAEGTAPKCHK